MILSITPEQSLQSVVWHVYALAAPDNRARPPTESDALCRRGIRGVAMALRRVALVIGQLGLGGTERQVVLLADGLTRRGYQVSVVCLFEGGPRESELASAGVPVFRLGLRRWRASGMSAIGNLFALLGYVRLLRRLRVDVVHAFLYHSYVITPVCARLARVPVVVAGRRSLGNFKGGSRLLLLIERVATSITDLVIANSAAVAADARREERLAERKLVVVPNALADSAFETLVPCDLHTSRQVVMCVANLKWYKGHTFLLAAMAQAQERGAALTLVLVGEGPSRPELEQLARDLNLDVRFLGARTDVPSLLPAADIVVLPSLEEGMSNAVLEAMAAGRPVIATDVGGNSEALGTAGLLVPPGDPHALAECLLTLSASPSMRCDLGARGRARAQELFSVDRMVDRHVELYEELLTSCAE